MKSVKPLLTVALAIFSVSLFAQNPTLQTDTIKVYGKCGMCKNRIQKSLVVDGVATAEWNTETRMLIVSYDPSKITNDDIQKKVASVGHDTEKYSADDEVYNNLPGCCHYERKKLE